MTSPKVSKLHQNARSADRVEDVSVVKIPYDNLNDRNSVDLKSGAQQIINLIVSKEYINLLKHNLVQSKKFNSKEIAKKYIDLFSLLD